MAGDVFHFSHDGDIALFAPRPISVPPARPPGMDWLNGPLVWAIDEAHQPMYLFPRDCPRVLAWPTAPTSATDRAAYFPDAAPRLRAWIEMAWLDRMRAASIYRYRLPGAAFENLHDAGMQVARVPVAPIDVTRIDDLPGALAAAGCSLETVVSFAELRALRATSLHVSAIRMRHAVEPL